MYEAVSGTAADGGLTSSTTASEPPETMVAPLRQTWTAMHEAGARPRGWNTGTTYDLPSQGTLDDRAGDYAMRFYVVGIYGTSLTLERPRVGGRRHE